MFPLITPIIEEFLIFTELKTPCRIKDVATQLKLTDEYLQIFLEMIRFVNGLSQYHDTEQTRLVVKDAYQNMYRNTLKYIKNNRMDI